MTFTLVPEQYAPLGSELRYAVAAEGAAAFDVRFYDDSDGSLLGAKRFAGVETASFDAAPCLRRGIRFIPATGRTGFHLSEGRSVTARVEVHAPTREGPVAEPRESSVAAPLRTFVPGERVAEVPSLRTTMPRTRLIAAGESEELTLVTEGPCSVTVTAVTAGETASKSYRVTAGGLSLFRLDTRDFPGAETLTADAGPCGAVTYTVIPATAGACRLAWRSSAGSIEHYTFPIEKSVRIETAKTKAYGPDGYVTATASTQHRRVLVSAYETRAVVEALAETVSSPDVWLVDDKGYTPVDVTTDAAVVHRHGAVSCFEVEIRPKRKTGTAWS